jgi:hypothetical protein
MVLRTLLRFCQRRHKALLVKANAADYCAAAHLILMVLIVMALPQRELEASCKAVPVVAANVSQLPGLDYLFFCGALNFSGWRSASYDFLARRLSASGL